MSNKIRESNLELFRIVAMLAIVAHHYVVNSGALQLCYETPRTVSSLFLLVFGAFGKTGINCFILIGAYFLCKSEIRYGKLVKLLAEILFYNTAISCLFWSVGGEPFVLKTAVKHIIPIYGIGTGFIPSYLVYFLLMPYLNKFVGSLTKREHGMFIATALAVYSLLDAFAVAAIRMDYVLWFMILHAIAAYIRIYPERFSLEYASRWKMAAAIILAIAVASIVLGGWASSRNCHFAHYLVFDSAKPLAVALAVSLFVVFKNLQIGHVKIINVIAGSCFGVLLIHANSDMMRAFLWDRMCHVSGHVGGGFVDTLIHATTSVCAIYMACTVIDMARKCMLVLSRSMVNYYFKVVS